MELSRKNLHLSTIASRERLNPIPSSSFYSTTKPYQEHSVPHFENSTTYSVIMTDPGDASDAGPPSHETSASPPPAKRTRLNFKGKTPTPSISASPPANRVNTRRPVPLASSTSTSVAGDAQGFAPLIIPDV